MPASGPRSDGASGLVLATQKLGGITGRRLVELLLVADRRRRRAPAGGVRAGLSRRLVALGTRTRGGADRAPRALSDRTAAATARAGGLRRHGARSARRPARRDSVDDGRL